MSNALCAAGGGRMHPFIMSCYKTVNSLHADPVRHATGSEYDAHHAPKEIAWQGSSCLAAGNQSSLGEWEHSPSARSVSIA